MDNDPDSFSGNYHAAWPTIPWLRGLGLMIALAFTTFLLLYLTAGKAQSEQNSRHKPEAKTIAPARELTAAEQAYIIDALKDVARFIDEDGLAIRHPSAHDGINLWIKGLFSNHPKADEMQQRVRTDWKHFGQALPDAVRNVCIYYGCEESTRPLSAANL